LRNWDIGWSCALENAAGVNPSLMILIDQIRPVAYEPTYLGKVSIIIHCRYCTPCHERSEVHTIAEKLTRAPPTALQRAVAKYSKGYHRVQHSCLHRGSEFGRPVLAARAQRRRLTQPPQAAGRREPVAPARAVARLMKGIKLPPRSLRPMPGQM